MSSTATATATAFVGAPRPSHWALQRGSGGGGALLAWAAAAAAARSRRRGPGGPRSPVALALASAPPAPPSPLDRALGGGSAPFVVDGGVLPPSRSVAPSAPSSPLADRTPFRADVARWLEGGGGGSSAVVRGSPSVLLAANARGGGSPERPPTPEEVSLLRRAFALFYGAGPERDVEEAERSLGECIATWEATGQGGDEVAGLYRVRGDARMELLRPIDAEGDYAEAIRYLEGADGYKADPEELPAARLGRARAIRSQGAAASSSKALQASNDYRIYFNSISRLDEDDVAAAASGADNESFTDAIIDGMQRNPYAAWEWGMVSRVGQRYDMAAEIHRLAAEAFEEIGDKPRSVICALDRGIDMAAGLDVAGGRGKGGEKDGGKKLALTREALEDAIASDVNVEGRDVELLQRVVAKEGEARVALAGVLWNADRRAAAEDQYGTACSRLDELNEDYRAREAERVRQGRMPPVQPRGASLGFSIDDIVGANEASCSRFKNEKFVEEKLVWNDPLRAKVKQFLLLGR
ncbi:hypothetical protein ACHAWF_012829 [Thalassiosira exigua]